MDEAFMRPFSVQILTTRRGTTHLMVGESCAVNVRDKSGPYSLVDGESSNVTLNAADLLKFTFKSQLELHAE